MTGPTCTGTRKDGLACRAPALPGRAQCFAHDPANAERAKAARSKGAQRANASNALRRKLAILKDMDALAGFVSTVVMSTLNGKLATDVARTCLYGCSIQKSILETADLEQRLTALESQLAPKGKASWPA